MHREQRFVASRSYTHPLHPPHHDLFEAVAIFWGLSADGCDRSARTKDPQAVRRDFVKTTVETNEADNETGVKGTFCWRLLQRLLPSLQPLPPRPSAAWTRRDGFFPDLVEDGYDLPACGAGRRFGSNHRPDLRHLLVDVSKRPTYMFNCRYHWKYENVRGGTKK